MIPRLEVCYFGGARQDDPFERMVRVLRATAEAHCQGWRVNIEQFDPTPRESAIGKAAHVHNAQKVERWHTLVRDAPDGDCLLLMDADTAILRSLDDIWSRPFDVAYTVKKRPFPYNLGVLFIRVSGPVRMFFRTWRDESLLMLYDREAAAHWRQTHGGITQASFGRLLERGALDGLHLERLPCLEWNCEESGWHKFTPGRTRILHIKGDLRRMLFHRRFPSDDLTTVAAAYRALEAETMARLARPA